MSALAPRKIDVPVCWSCKKALPHTKPRVIDRGGYLCSDCAYFHDHPEAKAKAKAKAKATRGEQLRLTA